MCTGFCGKPEGKRQLGTPCHRWEDNIKTYLQKMDSRVWTGLIWIRAGICVWAIVNTLMILQVQYNAGNFMTSSEIVSCSRRTLLHEIRWSKPVYLHNF